MSNTIEAVIMPKWGLAMTEGMVGAWEVEEGSEVSAGQEICEIETSKLVNMFESPVAGLLRRRVVAEGDTVPVGALIAVIADASVTDEEIDAFVTRYQENFVPEEESESGPEPEAIDVDGQRMVYLRLGPAEGTPVLLLHGFGADMNGWLFNQDALAERAPVYLLDLPGHGKSEKKVGDGTAAYLASMVSKFIQQLGLTEVHLVGHSLGGAIALHCAASGAINVKSLTLISSAGLGSDINIDFLNGYIEAKRQKHLRPVLEQLVSDATLISSDMLEEVFRFKRIDGVTDGLKTLVSANFADGRQQQDLRPALAATKCPVTVIWGRDDQIIPASHADGLPDTVKVVQIERSGHVPQMETASQVNALILQQL